MIYPQKNQLRKITQSFEKTRKEVYYRNFEEIANKAQNMIDSNNTRDINYKNVVLEFCFATVMWITNLI